MWEIFLGIWLVSFVVLLIFYIESEVRWRSHERSDRRGEP